MEQCCRRQTVTHPNCAARTVPGLRMKLRMLKYIRFMPSCVDVHVQHQVSTLTQLLISDTMIPAGGIAARQVRRTLHCINHETGSIFKALRCDGSVLLRCPTWVLSIVDLDQTLRNTELRSEFIIHAVCVYNM
jgi:hypothetical protein